MPPRPSPSVVPVRPAALFAACVVHGLAGETAPAALGPVEVAVALLLALAVERRRAIGLLGGVLGGGAGPDLRVRLAILALHALVWPPFLLAVAAGAPVADVARDVVPLAFLALWLVLPDDDRARTVDALVAGLLVAGVTLAVRARIGAVGPWSGTGPAPPWADDLLMNDPSVTFAAALCTVVALRASGVRALAAGIFAAGLVFALAEAGHRAGVTACVAVALVAAADAGARGRLVAVSLVVATAVTAGFGDGVVAAFDGIVAKTIAVGWNARPAEFAAAVAAAADGPFGLLFGQGWGARFVNPATGGDPVRYAHGVWAHLLIKGGLVGVAAGLVAAAATVAPVLTNGAWSRSAPVLAALPTLAVGATVHTSHKFLTYGLVLAVVALVAAKRLETQP